MVNKFEKAIAKLFKLRLFFLNWDFISKVIINLNLAHLTHY